MSTAQGRTIALLNLIEQDTSEWAKDNWTPPEGIGFALLQLADCLRLIVRTHPGVAAMAETYAARAAEELGLIEDAEDVTR